MYLCDLSCLGGLCLMFSLIQRDLKDFALESRTEIKPWPFSLFKPSEERNYLKGLYKYYFKKIHFALRADLLNLQLGRGYISCLGIAWTICSYLTVSPCFSLQVFHSSIINQQCIWLLYNPNSPQIIFFFQTEWVLDIHHYICNAGF